jgi:hypothetical protein
MELRMVAGRVIFMSRVVIGWEAEAGRISHRTAKKPTPIRANSPTRLENKTGMESSVTDTSFLEIAETGKGRSAAACAGENAGSPSLISTAGKGTAVTYS